LDSASGLVPRGDEEASALRSGKPAVSGVLVGPLIKRHVVAVAVPVTSHNTIELVLAVGVPLKRFSDVLNSLDIPNEQLVTVTDHHGTIVTRSQKHEEFAGTPVAYVLATPPPAEMQAINREGIAYHWFNRPSEVARWIVSVGIKEATLNAPYQQALMS